MHLTQLLILKLGDVLHKNFVSLGLKNLDSAQEQTGNGMGSTTYEMASTDSSGLTFKDMALQVPTKTN